MKIDKQQLFILTLQDNFLDVVDLRIGYFVRILPLSIEIHSGQRTAVTTVYHPIGIQHRHDLHDELVSEFLGVGMVAECPHNYESKNYMMD